MASAEIGGCDLQTGSHTVKVIFGQRDIAGG